MSTMWISPSSGRQRREIRPDRLAEQRLAGIGRVDRNDPEPLQPQVARHVERRPDLVLRHPDHAMVRVRCEDRPQLRVVSAADHGHPPACAQKSARNRSGRKVGTRDSEMKQGSSTPAASLADMGASPLSGKAREENVIAMSARPARARRRVKRHRGGVRDVERAERPRRRDPRQPVAELARSARAAPAPPPRAPAPAAARRSPRPPRSSSASRRAVEPDDGVAHLPQRSPSRRRGSAPAGTAAAPARPTRPWRARRSRARNAAAARSPPAPRRPRPSAAPRRRCAGRSPGRAAAPAARRPRGAQTSDTEPQSSGSTSSAAPWCTDCASSGAVEAARVDDLGRHPGGRDRLRQPVGGVPRHDQPAPHARRDWPARRAPHAARTARRVPASLRAAPAPARSPSPVSCSSASPLCRSRRSHAPAGLCNAPALFAVLTLAPLPSPAIVEPSPTSEGWLSGQMQRTVNPSG